MRLIDADALREKMDFTYPFDKETQSKHNAFDVAKGEFILLMNTMPTADVVEAVRCKNCIHFESKDYVMFCKHPDGLDSIKPESFCSYGEKKDAEIH